MSTLRFSWDIIFSCNGLNWRGELSCSVECVVSEGGLFLGHTSSAPGWFSLVRRAWWCPSPAALCSSPWGSDGNGSCHGHSFSQIHPVVSKGPRQTPGSSAGCVVWCVRTPLTTPWQGTPLWPASFVSATAGQVHHTLSQTCFPASHAGPPMPALRSATRGYKTSEQLFSFSLSWRVIAVASPFLERS